MLTTLPELSLAPHDAHCVRRDLGGDGLNSTRYTHSTQSRNPLPQPRFDGGETPVLEGRGGGDASSFAATLEADAMMMSFAPPRSSGDIPHPPAFASNCCDFL